MDKPIYSAELKLVLLGESSVGKSSIVSRLTTGQFQKNNATIGAAFTTKTIRVENDTMIKQVKLEIWDTAGQERYRSLAPMYYRKTDVALVVFDVTDKNTMSKAQSWIDELNSYVEQEEAENLIIKIVGNKIDLSPQLLEYDMEWFPVSAKTGQGIENLFRLIAEEIPYDKFIQQNTIRATQENQVNLSSKEVISNCSC
ncbi:LAFE_0F07888g1_1 [Lachancea fermentati]|uniref:LAFE_0F07888g1_1 n=1 Tax=Lachancea fermentati TaxID=4955 RepID=A0A1G4MF01_LACFM|nr:LAFE_0F07888g1_1 [Lachancea fermentati]